MANLLSTGAAWLASQLQTHVGSQMTYRRGAQSVTRSFTKGRSTTENVDDNGLLTRTNVADFLLPAGDLILSGETDPTFPQKGDTLEETIDGVTTVYDVLPIAGEECFQNDPNNQQLRIHTKQRS